MTSPNSLIVLLREIAGLEVELSRSTDNSDQRLSGIA